MIIEEKLKELADRYSIVSVVNLDEMDVNYETARHWLEVKCTNLHKTAFENNERIVFTQTSEWYTENDTSPVILRTLQRVLNAIDISNFFVVVLSTNPDLDFESTKLALVSTDPVPINSIFCDGNFTKRNIKSDELKYESYRYGSPTPTKIHLNDLTDRQKFLLTESKTFCIYPWIHLHAYPTGEAWPCCYADMKAGPVGNCRKDSLDTIANGEGMRTLRNNMLTETKSAACNRCYEQEESGFFSGRQSANKHHGHHIEETYATNPDGSVDNFTMTYWDIRFSNLCNLKCRSCGHIFSSQWYQDQVKLAGPEWAKTHKVLNYAGRNKTDIWEQLIKHIDYVEQIYFAGGEPLLMEEHYHILEELERRGRFDVRLIYNTNFTEVRLKDRLVFDYWKKFKSVAVGASLDAMGPRAEYIRKGTDWNQVERNREEMLRICPQVDFYISPTLSIMNALHLPDFHRDWVEKGLIRPQDLNVNILQDPAYYRIDIASPSYKKKIQDKFEQHLEWLRPLDQLNRATVGFESAIKFMNSIDNTHLIDKFWKKTHELDAIRNESIFAIIPELEAL